MTEGGKLHVLIIDDDATTRMLTAETLREAGLETSEAGSGEDGLARFSEAVPDLVLLDVMMPGIDGFEVCRRMRCDPRAGHVPIIMLTGLEDSGSIDQAFEAGATDFIVKPINWKLLRHRVRYVLRSAATTEALADSEDRLLGAQRMARMGSWDWNAASDRLSSSRTCAELFGVDPDDFGRSLEAPLEHVHPAERDMLVEAISALRRGHAYQLEYRVVWPEGSVHTLRDIAMPELGPHGEVLGARGTVQDISEQVDADRRIRYLAYFDALTGLPNRNAFREALDATLLPGPRHCGPVAVLLLDLHRFGLLNDSLGRDASDQVLQMIASRVRDFARLELGGGDVADDTELAVAARYGSDQFALMVRERPGIDPRESSSLVTRLQAVISAPLHVQRHTLVMKCSVGIAVSPQHADNAESIMKCAETALRQAKREPSGGSVLEYASGMGERSVSRLRLESALRSALDSGQGLSVLFQPKVDFSGARMVGAEALLRWEDDTLGAVSPAEFIPFSEDVGMIVPLSEWVIESVCRQVAQWRDQELPRLPVAINLSATHFRFSGLLDTVVKALARHGLDGRDIEFELTESALMGDVELCSQILGEMHSRGLRVAVDDFGTGYSSLAYLKRLPLSALKIDRSFVRDIDSDPSDAAIVTAVVAMANRLGMGVVGEGVESGEQARHLARIGCNIMQGSHFARPLAAERYAALLRDGADSLQDIAAA